MPVKYLNPNVFTTLRSYCCLFEIRLFVVFKNPFEASERTHCYIFVQMSHLSIRPIMTN